MLTGASPAILDDMRRGWRRDPSAIALGSAGTGLSAALWTHEVDDVQEVRAEPHPDEHIISLAYGAARAEMIVDDKLRFCSRLHRGVLCLVTAGERPRALLEGKWRILHLYIPRSLPVALVEQAGHDASRLELIDPAGTMDPEIERIGRSILTEMLDGQPLSRLRIDSLGQDLVIQILRRWSSLAGSPAGRRSFSGGLSPAALRRVRQFIDANLADELTLQLLANAAGLSCSHFRAAFQRSTGRTPSRYVAERRIERARDLLAVSELPLSAVALACGYCDQQHFSRRFREATGSSPKAFRNEMR